MDFAVMTEPQIGGTYDELLEIARWAEANGLVSFARSDHYYSSREPRPDATDAFATLAGLAKGHGRHTTLRPRDTHHVPSPCRHCQNGGNDRPNVTGSARPRRWDRVDGPGT